MFSATLRYAEPYPEGSALNLMPSFKDPMNDLLVCWSGHGPSKEKSGRLGTVNEWGRQV